ncbi:hypothetical protein ACFFQF_16935 [Haladaptatus pallidirubidus]|uniref:Uncharacterized protein n=1 Tax=Haladaptatus pallidirubidus TaxID=1008152 RepID=A0AAV3UQU5_9EURY|nr:hypothetical protein [Haladaptatus pallidirubidus]
MKRGSGDDPFGHELDNGEDVTVQDKPTENESRENSSSVPWAVERSSVKSGREMVQFYLQENTQKREDDFKRDVEEEAGYNVYTTDLREAAYLVAMEHADEVAEMLDEWGCEYS